MINIAIVALVVMAAAGTKAQPAPPGSSPVVMGDCSLEQAQTLQTGLQTFLNNLLAQTTNAQAVVALIRTRCDANGDSSLTVTEFTDCLKADVNDDTISDDCYGVFLPMINQNGDDVIDVAELEALIRMALPPSVPRP